MKSLTLMRKVNILTLFFLLSLTVQAQKKDSSKNLIFNPQRDSIWLPATYVLNGTFDVIQNPYWFEQKNYNEKMTEVWRRVKDPDYSIRKDGGYRKLIEDEFFSSRVLPNIGLHMIGASYDTLWLTEYFNHYKVPYASFWAFTLTYLAHFGNEALETTSGEISSHDHIADLYVFDVAAFFLAQNRTAMNYLIDDMGMKAWHFNPMYDVDGEDFFNAGLNYIFRPKAFHMMEGKLRPLYYLGMQTLLGSTYDYKDNQSFSLAMGISLTNPLKQKGRFVTGLFHETDGELDASLFLNGSEDYRWRLNLYDNLWNRSDWLPKDWQFGVMVGQGKGPTYALGININMPFGLGGIKNSPSREFKEINRW
jgi:hypothetical protein